MTDKRRTGNIAEQAVVDAMTSKGFQLITRNYNVHNVGEIDIAMRKGDTVYIIEVKSRLSGNPYQSSCEAVLGSKRRKVINTTKYLLRHYGLEEYDVIFLAGCVTHNKNGLVQKIEIIPFE